MFATVQPAIMTLGRNPCADLGMGLPLYGPALLCRNLHFLERLLADGPSLEYVWPESGETPLLMAITWKDVEVGAPAGVC
jgi:hypothetical protein